MRIPRVLAGIAVVALAGMSMAPLVGSASALVGDVPSVTSTSTTDTTLAVDDDVELVEDGDPTIDVLDPVVELVDGLDGSDDPAATPDEPATSDPEDDTPAPTATEGPDAEPQSEAPPSTSPTANTQDGAVRVVPAPRPSTSVTSSSPIAPAPRAEPAEEVPVDEGVASAAPRPGPRPDGGRPTTYVVKEKRASRSTNALFDILGGLDLAPSAIARLVAPFPVAGVAHYNDDFGDPRRDPGGPLRSHQGTDVFAERGTPVVAASAGRVSLGRGGRAGDHVRLVAVDGTTYLYAHLDRFAGGLHSNDSVMKGEVIGFVGTTGNAEATAPHVHFEIRDAAGQVIDPVPHLDRWIEDATSAARGLAGTSFGAAGFKGSRSLIESSSDVVARRARAAHTVGGRPETPSVPRSVWTAPIAFLRGGGAAGGLAVVPAVAALGLMLAVVIRRASH